MIIYKASYEDIEHIAQLYSVIHDAEETGQITIGWKRNVYPTKQTAIDAIGKEDMFLLKDNDEIIASAIINQVQLPCYAYANWKYEDTSGGIMVLHTLVVNPRKSAKGYGTAFVHYYEQYAAMHNCSLLRMDTQEHNISARKLYAKLGYHEADILPIYNGFNGLSDIQLVFLEKII